jgi:thiamine-phosphate pyrophosphorylase
MKKIGILHVLTDTTLQTRFTHAELAERAIRGGADTIQFRHKHGTTRELMAMARSVGDICRQSGVTFIVNDRVDIAFAVEADGAHVGQDDLPVPIARRILGSDKIVGVSAEAREHALRAEQEGADYIGFGPVFPTGSKPDAAAPSGLKTLQKVCQSVHLPVIAIGGITADNVEAAIAAGAHGVAVISAVCCAPDPAKATQELFERIRHAKGF